MSSMEYLFLLSILEFRRNHAFASFATRIKFSDVKDLGRAVQECMLVDDLSYKVDNSNLTLIIYS